jgi:DNA repair exonuclease SbcCD ATPase subunit
LENAKKLLQQFDEKALTEEAEENTKLKENLTSLLNERKETERNLELYNKRIGILDDIPCGDKYKTSCKFIENAFAAQDLIPAANLSLAVAEEKSISLRQKLDNSQADHLLGKIRSLKTKVLEGEHTITSLQLQVSQEEQKKTALQQKIETLREKLDYYEQNKEAIVNAALLKENRRQLELDIHESKRECNYCRDDLLKLHKQEGSLQAQLTENQNKRNELEKTRREFSAYDLFMKCMHPNGIAFGIIKNKLPVINEAITEVLANVVEFNVYFEDNGRKLDIFIQHKDQNARPLELGSGAEKTLAAMAIRIALLNVSNAPKADILVMDEPGTALDANNMEGFTRVLDMAREHFTTTLLITHIDSLKDNVDKVITIEAKDGHAHVEE